MIGKKSKFQENVKAEAKESRARARSESKIQADTDQEKETTEKVQENRSNTVSDSNNSNNQKIRRDVESEAVFEAELRKNTNELGNDESPSEKENESIEQENQEVDYSERKSNKNSSSNSSKNKGVILKLTNTKTDTALLWDEIMNGVSGKNSGIPMGFNRLNKYIGLRKSIYTLIGAGTGIGKTALVDCAYVLNPYDWYIKNQATSKVKFEVVYFSMERKKTYKLAKWLCMKIWKEEGVLITVDELLSWGGTLDKVKQDMANFYLPYFEEMIESGIVKIIDGAINPTGIYKYIKANALARGKEEDKNQYEKVYIADDDNLITNVIEDHIGCIKRESIGGSYDKKANIDKLSEYNRIARDLYHYSPVAISQFNRTSYTDIQQAKKDGVEPEPTLEYFKDSGNTQEDADVILTLFNPLRYSISDYMEYDIDKFKNDQTGNFYFRSLKILKNSYGTADVRIGMGFLGEIGLFKELPKAQLITDGDYKNIVNNKFFR